MGFVVLVLMLAGLGLAGVGIMGLTGRLVPNHALGIRTAYTRASEANWYAAQRAGAPWLIFGGVATPAPGLACLPFVFAGAFAAGASIAVVVALAVILLVSATGGWIFGVWGARRGVLSTSFPQRDDR